MSIDTIRVLEVGDGLAVAFCGQQLARWGADVVTRADSAKALEPIVGGVSMTHAWLTANKRIVDSVGPLAHDATVILTDRELEHDGIVAGPDTIVHTIDCYAPGSEFAGCGGSSLLLEALSGYLVINGDPDREPVRTHANLIDYITGASAFGATLAAIHKLATTGEAGSVRTAALDVLTTITPFVRAQYTGEADRRHGGPATGVRLYPIGDGMISANLYGRTTFSSVLDAAGVDESLVPEELDAPKKRYDRPAMLEFLGKHTRGQRAAAIFEDMMSRGLPPIGLYQTLPQVLSNRHLSEIDYFEHADHERSAPLQVPGLPARGSRLTPPQFRWGRTDRSHWRARGLATKRLEPGSAPLSGIRVVDFTQAWIGPFATMMLADLGADVVKIESHKRVDVWRNWPGNIPAIDLENPRAHPHNTSGNFNSTNRNKREIAIDLTMPEGQSIARDLVKEADIVVDNYTPRVMRQFGLDYESLAAIKPDIIAVSWSGYGTRGPYADFKANGTTIEAIAGWDALFGYHDREPMVMGYYQMDAITGLQMAACTLLALVHRDLTGEGQQVTGSMIEAAIPYVGEEILAASAGAANRRWGNRHPHCVPHGVFPCDGDDSWIALACQTEARWSALADLIGIDQIGDIEARRKREDEIEAAISNWTRARGKDEAAQALRQRGIPAAPVLDGLEVLASDEFGRRDWFQVQFHEDVGDKLYGGFPWTFADSKLEARLPPPRLGEHTREILESLGYADEAIERLFAADIVGCVLVGSE